MLFPPLVQHFGAPRLRGRWSPQDPETIDPDEVGDVRAAWHRCPQGMSQGEEQVKESVIKLPPLTS